MVCIEIWNENVCWFIRVHVGYGAKCKMELAKTKHIQRKKSQWWCAHYTMIVSYDIYYICMFIVH